MNETCPVCGQPDNCGDCTHVPVTRTRGTVPMTEWDDDYPMSRPQRALARAAYVVNYGALALFIALFVISVYHLSWVAFIAAGGAWGFWAEAKHYSRELNEDKRARDRLGDATGEAPVPSGGAAEVIAGRGTGRAS